MPVVNLIGLAHFAESRNATVYERGLQPDLVRAHRTAEWIANQLTAACGWEQVPRYLIRDRDGAYGEVLLRRIRSMGIRDRPTLPRSPWQNGYAERLIGSIRRECVDHVVILGERHLCHILQSYAKYQNEVRTHLFLEKDAPAFRVVERRGVSHCFLSLRRTAPSICPDLIYGRHRDRLVTPNSWGLHHHYVRV